MDVNSVWNRMSVVALLVAGLALVGLGCPDDTRRNPPGELDAGEQAPDGGDADGASSDAMPGGDSGSDTGPETDGGDCEPRECGEQDCGTIDDECGGTIDCGECGGDQVCGSAESPNRCVAPDWHCDSGEVDGNETDVDCGGRCSPCEKSESCEVASDCKSGACVEGTCRESPRWTTVTTMPVERTLTTATFADNGRMYVVGGRNDGGAMAAVHVYRPKDDAWSRLQDLPQPRYGHSTVATGDGELVVIGGVVEDRNGDTATVRNVLRLDISENQWSRGQPMNRPRRYFGAVRLDDGRIFAVGGLNNNTPVEVNSTVEIFDPSNSQWTETARKLNNPRNSHGVAVGGDGNIYAVAGRGDGDAPQALEYREPGAAGWFTVEQNLLRPRASAPAIRGPDGNVWITGGFGGRDESVLGTTEYFDPSSDSVESGPGLDIHRRQHAAARGPSGRLYVVGGTVSTGEATSGPTATVEKLVE